MDTSIYKTDTSVKRTPKKRSLPFFAPSIWLSLLTFYKTDISLRRTASAGPKGVRLREMLTVSYEEKQRLYCYPTNYHPPTPRPGLIGVQ